MPAAHARQVEELVAPVVLEAVPGEHRAQTDCPVAEEKDPASQEVQDGAAAVAAMEPGEQSVQEVEPIEEKDPGLHVPEHVVEPAAFENKPAAHWMHAAAEMAPTVVE